MAFDPENPELRELMHGDVRVLTENKNDQQQVKKSKTELWKIMSYHTFVKDSYPIEIPKSLIATRPIIIL